MAQRSRKEQQAEWRRIAYQEQRLKETVGAEVFFRDYVFKVTRLPSPKCGLCYGRGHGGWDVQRGRVTPCQCVGNWSIVHRGKLAVGDVWLGFAGSVVQVEELLGEGPKVATFALPGEQPAPIEEGAPCAASTAS